MATLYEMQTIYGLTDVLDFHEVMVVNAHNQRIMAKRRRER